jgi:hypothetical protein
MIYMLEYCTLKMIKKERIIRVKVQYSNIYIILAYHNFDNKFYKYSCFFYNLHDEERKNCQSPTRLVIFSAKMLEREVVSL